MIRFATPSDAEQIAAIHVDAWRAAYAEIVPVPVLASLSVAARSEGWRRGIVSDPRRVLLAEVDDRVAGWIAVGPCRDDDAKQDGEVYAIYVRPDLWRGGYGRALMERGEAELWDRGFTRIVLWVLERNEPARAFYDRIGYLTDGTTKDVTMDDVTLREIRYEKQRHAQPGATDNPDDAQRLREDH